MSNHKIGGIIAGLRREKGCTQEELARAVCVSPQAVSKWENGGVPDTELLPAIADFFAVPIDVLFGRSGAGYQDIMRELAKKIADTAPAQSFDAVLICAGSLNRPCPAACRRMEAFRIFGKAWAGTAKFIPAKQTTTAIRE